MCPNKCVHINVDRGKYKKPYIVLNIAGACETVTACTECHTVLNEGGTVRMIMTTKQNKTYDVCKAKESTEPIFFTVRTVQVIE